VRPIKDYGRRFCRQLTKDGWEATDTGWLLTIVIEIVVLSLGLRTDCQNSVCTDKFTQFVSLKPSEMGDTLAGIFGALVFVWIIVTVFLQRTELREQRSEFKAERIATQEMAVAQGKQVELLTAQAQIFELEQKQRYEDRAKLELDELLWSFAAVVGDESDLKDSWQFQHPPNVIMSSRRVFSDKLSSFKTAEKLDDKVRIALQSLASFGSYALNKLNSREIIGRSKNKQYYEEVNQLLVRIVALESRLSTDQMFRIERVDPHASLRVLEQLFQAEIWDQSA